MAVYDWGEDDVPFMVLELLTGREPPRPARRRRPADARRRRRTSAARSPRALEYAHARGVVHRDIKPANLLFDEHGIVRVADFGLARALAEASWTEPAGTVVGTARYAAPEQATGAPLDGRADLYSLAVVLVEAVTAPCPRSPTPRSARSRRARTPPLVAPLALGRLGPVVERAGRPDPADRYPDAATMRAALADAGARAPAAAAARARRARRRDRRRRAHPDRTARRRAVRPGRARVDAAAPSTPTPVAPAKPTRRRRAPGAVRWVSVAVLGAILLALVGGGVALAATRPAGTVAVPSLVGLTTKDGHRRGRAGRAHRCASSSSTADDPKDVVIAQHPAPGVVHERRRHRSSWSCRADRRRSRSPTSPASHPTTPRPRSSTPASSVNVKHQYDETVPADGVIGTDPAGRREGAARLDVSCS